MSFMCATLCVLPCLSVQGGGSLKERNVALERGARGELMGTHGEGRAFFCDQL